MIALDTIGPLLVLFAIALMSVAPLQLTIARSKAARAWVAAMAGDDGEGTPPAPDSETVATKIQAEFAGNSPRPAQARGSRRL